MYVNVKCRICGKVISFEMDSLEASMKASSLGFRLSSKFHTTCIVDIECTEKVFCDLISTSKDPLKRASEVYTIEQRNAILEKGEDNESTENS